MERGECWRGRGGRCGGRGRQLRDVQCLADLDGALGEEALCARGVCCEGLRDDGVRALRRCLGHLALEECVEAVCDEEVENLRVLLLVEGVEGGGDELWEVLLGHVVVIYDAEGGEYEELSEAPVPDDRDGYCVLEERAGAGAAELEDEGLDLREGDGAAEHRVDDRVADGHAVALEVPHACEPDEDLDHLAEDGAAGLLRVAGVLVHDELGAEVLVRAGRGLRADERLARPVREDLERRLDELLARRLDGERVPAGRARRRALALAHLDVVAPAGRARRHVQDGLPRPGHHVEHPPAAREVPPVDGLPDHRPVRVRRDVPLVDDEQDRDVLEQGTPDLLLEGLDPRPRAVDHVPHNVDRRLQRSPDVLEELLGARDELGSVPVLEALAVVDDHGQRLGLVAVEVSRHGLPGPLLGDFLAKDGVDE